MIALLVRLASPLRGPACVEAMRLIAALGEWQAALAGLATVALDDDAALVTLACDRACFLDAVEAAERHLAVAVVVHAVEADDARRERMGTLDTWRRV